MREILFRGKRADTGEWVEGFYTLYNDNRGMKSAIITGTDKMCFIPVEIIPETLGQYTGLKANGKKIFEGDLVQYYGSNVLEVYIENGHTKTRWFDTVSRSECSDLFFGYDEGYGEVEVIGNIHDNPELMKGGVDNA